MFIYKKTLFMRLNKIRLRIGWVGKIVCTVLEMIFHTRNILSFSRVICVVTTVYCRLLWFDLVRLDRFNLSVSYLAWRSGSMFFERVPHHQIALGRHDVDDSLD